MKMPTSPALVPPLSPSAIRSLRLSSTFPHISPTTPLPTALRLITHTLLAVQAQDPDAALLSYWLRLPQPRPTRAQLSSLLLQGSHNSPVRRLWANRVTLQCVCTADAQPLRTAVKHYLEKNRLSAIRRRAIGDAAVRVYEVTAAFLRERLQRGEQVDSGFLDELVSAELEKERTAAGTRAERSRFTEREVTDAKQCIRYSLFVLATANGYAERVLKDGMAKRIVVAPVEETRDVIGVDEATLHCCRRYFTTYGPCTEGDFRYWMGIAAGASKKAVNMLLEEGGLEEVVTDVGPMLMAKGMKRRAVVEEGIRLVGRFEPILLAHKDKLWIVGERERKRVWNSHSDVTACVMKRGRIRGTWRKDGSNLKVRLFADGDEALEEQDVDEVFQNGGHILREFYEKKGEVTIEREKADGEVELLRESERRGGGGSVNCEEDEDHRRRFRKRRRRT